MTSVFVDGVEQPQFRQISSGSTYHANSVASILSLTSGTYEISVRYYANQAHVNDPGSQAWHSRSIVAKEIR